MFEKKNIKEGETVKKKINTTFTLIKIVDKMSNVKINLPRVQPQCNDGFPLFAGAAAVVTSAGGHGFDAHLRGPSFLIEPPSRVEFSNSSGAWLDCTASGSPPPNIDWSTADGHPVNDVPTVRRVLRNGTLVLLPFPAAAYRQDVHSAAYRCFASNSVGRVLSRDVQVRAGECIEKKIKRKK